MADGWFGNPRTTRAGIALGLTERSWVISLVAVVAECLGPSGAVTLKIVADASTDAHGNNPHGTRPHIRAGPGSVCHNYVTVPVPGGQPVPWKIVEVPFAAPGTMETHWCPGMPVPSSNPPVAWDMSVCHGWHYASSADNPSGLQVVEGGFLGVLLR
jgi:hypothetical protein